jgi:hypothetical protein
MDTQHSASIDVLISFCVEGKPLTAEELEKAYVVVKDSHLYLAVGAELRRVLEYETLSMEQLEESV